MLYQLSYRTMYRGSITLSVLLSAVTFSTVTIHPIVHVDWLIILKHFIISFCLLKHYITTLCCCQVVFLIIMLYKPYQLKHLNFPTYLFYTNRNCQLYLGSYNLRLPSPTLSVWNSLPIFDFAGLEPVTHLLAKRVPNYTISQYNIRLYSSNHNIYGNGYEDYNIFYQGLIS